MVSAVTGLALRADSRDLADIEAAGAWAGSYWFSELNSTMSFRLVIAPDSGYTLYMSGCFNTSVESRGIVTYRHGLLRLYPRESAPGGDFTPDTLVPMKQGERLYLVDAARPGPIAVYEREGNPQGSQPL